MEVGKDGYLSVKGIIILDFLVYTIENRKLSKGRKPLMVQR